MLGFSIYIYIYNFLPQGNEEYAQAFTNIAMKVFPHVKAIPKQVLTLGGKLDRSERRVLNRLSKLVGGEQMPEMKKPASSRSLKARRSDASAVTVDSAGVPKSLEDDGQLSRDGDEAAEEPLPPERGAIKRMAITKRPAMKKWPAPIEVKQVV